MMFAQEPAGNAQRTWSLRPGAAVSSIRHLMLSRPLATIAALSLALTLPAASAHASDPLLSGYGGPGAGEQVVVGGTVKPSGSSSSAAAQDPESASLEADTGAASSAGASGAALTSKPQRKKSSSSSSKDKSDDNGQSTTSGTTTTATLPGAPEVVAYPTRAGDAGGLPLSAPGVLLIVLGIAAATLVGLGLRRLSGFDRASDPQVSGR
jgi:hypothetical protein